jgi:2-oxoglutarate ferredoxin oxidoreductase subunit alpha
MGYEKGSKKFDLEVPPKSQNILNYSGNEALVEGILKAECGFAAIYPMTPINSILTMLSGLDKVEVFRPEDEIAGIMSALGASYAGKRAMVATSGGGFSLMVEGLGMAGMAEIPIVCVVGQRTGPSTGMATFSSQADLNFVINAGQGEFPRIVLAPGDIEECYRLGAEAFNLAEKYQVPVILLTDKYLAENRFSTDALGTFEYKKFPRILPGEAIVRFNSYEHDELGFSSDDQENREKMMKKRMTKLSGLKGGFEIFGQGKKVLIGWGSTKTIILDYLRDHPEYCYLHVWRPWPFPAELTTILKDKEEITAIEGNYSGQLADLIEKHTFKKVKRILKDNGRPFFKEEI